jgi:hypothetical protein
VALREKPPAEDFRKLSGFSTALPYADMYALIASSERLMKIRGEPLCTFVNEIIGLPLALSIFPQVYDFAGEAVLELVEPGLYKKGWRVSHGTA